LALALISALPVLLARYPQMTDYPAHLATWHVWIEAGHNAAIDRAYAIDWHWIPNLGSEMLVRPLAALFGLEFAGRVIAALAPVLCALSFVATEWALRRRIGVGSLLALATVWSPALLMGFLNFALGLALSFLLFALWVRSECKAWRHWLFLALAPLVWICHLTGWGVVGVLVYGYEWQKRGVLRAIPATWPLWPPALLTLLSGAGTKGATAYGDGVLIDKLSNWIMGLRDLSAMLDLATVALLIALPLIVWGRGRVDGRIGRAALIFAALTFILPRFLGGGDFADYRLVPVALACGVLAIDWQLPRLWLALAALPFLLRLGVTSMAWHEDSQATAEMLEALDHVPQGAVVAGAYGEAPFAWRQPPFGHVFAYATIRKDGLTNSDFAISGVHMLRHKDPDRRLVDPSQRILLPDGGTPDLSAFYPASKAQYLWYVGPAPIKGIPAGAVEVYRNRQTILLRLANPQSSR
jgi:hypothetical protein